MAEDLGIAVGEGGSLVPDKDGVARLVAELKRPDRTAHTIADILRSLPR